MAGLAAARGSPGPGSVAFVPRKITSDEGRAALHGVDAAAEASIAPSRADLGMVYPDEIVLRVQPEVEQ